MSEPQDDERLLARTVVEHQLRESYLVGINRPLLAHLEHLSGEAVIIDLACGIGNPTMQIARTYPTAQRVLGIDTDEQALAVARHRAGEEALTNVEFEKMAMDALDSADNSADAMVSRLGALLFGDPVATSREMMRVLKPDAPFSFALWSGVEANPYMRVGLKALSEVLPATDLPDVQARFTPLSDPEVVEGWLRAAGLRTVDSELFRWRVGVADFASWWEYNSNAGPLSPLFRRLRDYEQRHVQETMKLDLQESELRSGGYRIASECRMVWGRK